jgi:sporulation protein YunB
MRKRIRLKKKIKLRSRVTTPMKKGTKLILSFIIVLILIMITFLYINKKVSPVLINYAETEMKKLSNLIINRAISKQMTEELNFDNLFLIDKNSAGEINTIDFNPVVVNKVLSTCTATVQLNLKYIEQGRLDLIDIPDALLTEYKNDNLKQGVIYQLPSGVIFGNSLLANLGPKIPVRLNLVGDIESNIHTKITDYGINNALVEVFVTIKVNEQVILPFISKTIGVSTDIPVAIKLISGKIPDSYFGNIGKTSTTFSLPVK